jgi:hypothetical protein
MDKDQKKNLKAQYKKNEQDEIRASIPMSVDELKKNKDSLVKKKEHRFFA